MFWLILAVLCGALAVVSWLRYQRTVRRDATADSEAAKAGEGASDELGDQSTTGTPRMAITGEEISEPPPPRRRRLRVRIPPKVLTWTLAGLAVIFFLMSILRIVPAGSSGVPVTFGEVGDQVGEGLHVVNPFTNMKIMSVRTQPYTMSGDKGNADSNAVLVLGRDGSVGRVDATLLYHLDQSEASRLYGEIGAQYRERVVRPTARACIRSAFTEKDIVEASTTAWVRLQDEIEQCIKDDLEPRGIVVEQLQLRELRLSDQVQKAVDGKVAAQQNAERQRFERQFAEQQAEIERVKALATADSQQILACGGESTTVEIDGQPVEVVIPNPIAACSQAQLTPQYLQFNYIQALRELVDSPNNSTIILPFDENLTPLLNVPGGSGPASVDTNAATSQGTTSSATPSADTSATTPATAPSSPSSSTTTTTAPSQ